LINPIITTYRTHYTILRSVSHPDALLKLIRVSYIIPSLGAISGSIFAARRLMIRFARATLRPARRTWRAPFRATRRTFRTTLRPARRTLRATLRPVRRDTRADRRARRLVRRRALLAFLSALAIVCLLRKTHRTAVARREVFKPPPSQPCRRERSTCQS
jgi:hypothetical protein